MFKGYRLTYITIAIIASIIISNIAGLSKSSPKEQDTGNPGIETVKDSESSRQTKQKRQQRNRKKNYSNYERERARRTEAAHSADESYRHEQQNINAANDAIDLPLSPEGLPEQILYRTAYVVSYNKETLIPNWVAWRLTAERATGQLKRRGNPFHEDTDVPSPRANNNDYRGSGWSRGHMYPAGDSKWNNDAMYESFLLSNICPQNRNLNSGVWNQIEITCRRWAEKYGDIYIVTGPVFLNKEHEAIGENEVIVPEAFFKVVVYLGKNPKGIGFICRNTDGDQKKDFYVNSIQQVERITKYKFFPNLPEEQAAKIKSQANIKDW